MKEITRVMINLYKMKELDMDFMGYSLQKGDIYTYHHLIIPRRHNGPMTIDNGAILCGKSSHPYLHTIENFDYDRFLAISSEMIDENIKGKLDIENLRMIHDILSSFEREYSGKTTKKGKPIIKEIYTKRRKL